MNTPAYCNPTPISKLLMTVFLALSANAQISEVFALAAVFFIAAFFATNGKIKTAVKALTFYGIVAFLFKTIKEVDYAFVKNYIATFLVVIKFFFLPALAGKFLIATSDVSSLIVSFEKMKFPKCIIIPMAVTFRYFPAFKDDKKNIKMAMKMRGITPKNPIRYLEFVSVPLLISAATITDDISKAAETKCISDPCKKIRYAEVRFRLADSIFIAGIVSCIIVGRMYA